MGKGAGVERVMSSTGVAADGPALDPVDPNRLGVRLLPDVRAQIVVVRLASQQPIEDILHGDEDVEVVAMRTAHERGHARAAE